MRVLLNYLYQYYPFTTASYIEMALKDFPKASVFRKGEDRVPCADVIINIEPCGEIISYPTAVSCYWEIDNHIHLGRDLDKYEKVDHVFVAQKFFLPLYQGKKVSWLPLGADPKLHRRFEDEPAEYDVGFLGNDTYARRSGLLDKIGKKYKLLRSTSKPGEDYSRKLSRCKILFNCSMDNDMNMRVFEAMSIGRLLVTDKVDGQDELFKDGVHYVSYHDWESLDKVISYYLTHTKERERIAKTGAEFIRAKHTYFHRLEQIMTKLNFY